MSVAQISQFRVQYRFNKRFAMKMIPWHRQVISLIYGIGVIMIALWALKQGNGPYVVLGVVGMSMLTLMMIFGVEVQEIQIGNVGQIVFSDTQDTRNESKKGDDD